MLFHIIHRDESGEESHGEIRITPTTLQTTSYVLRTGFDIRSACPRKNERILIGQNQLEFNVAHQYRVKLHRWTDPDTMPWVAINNLCAAQSWVAEDKAVFSLSIAAVYINSTDRVLTLYIPHNTLVEVGTEDAYITL